MTRLKGLGVSSGLAAGRALLLRQRAFDVRLYLADHEVEAEIGRLGQAAEASRRQLTAVRSRVLRAAGPDRAFIFEAQMLMLDDPMLTGRAAELIRSDRINAEWALQRAADELGTTFDQVEDPYLRERRADVADVVGRLRINLRPSSAPLLAGRHGPFLLVADDLPPSLAAQIDWTQIVGFATDTGSWTYHTAILARSLRVPAVIGLHDASQWIVPGTVVAIDGTSGDVLVDPDPAALALYNRELTTRPEPRQEEEDRPVATADGIVINLGANIELAEDVEKAREYGASTIGLYRSEYLLARSSLERLDEETQYGVYRDLLVRMHPGAVTIRTFDAREHQVHEDISERPARGRFGLQAIRLSLAFRELFRRQLRALLRAARHGNLRLMFPFVSGVEEFREAKGVLAEARRELQERGEETPHVPVGAMIEIPSAALTATVLAREADFFSIGTNDLIQGCLAVDRTDERVSHLYEPFHPAVLRLIRLVGRAGRRRNLPVAVCGEMAADPAGLALLIGLGITDFSMRPDALPVARRIVRAIKVAEIQKIVGGMIGLASATEIRVAVTGYLDAAERLRTPAPAIRE